MSATNPHRPDPRRTPAEEPGGQATHQLVGALGVRVLVVDDNPDQVMMLAASLRLNGFTVQSATTGEEGLDIALRWRPNIVLLDIGMPGMDGYEVARRLREAEREGPGREDAAGFPRMRLIALTGRGLDTDEALAREVGFAAYLTKPCDLEYLAMMMASLTPTKSADTKPSE